MADRFGPRLTFTMVGSEKSAAQSLIGLDYCLLTTKLRVIAATLGVPACRMTARSSRA